MTKGYKVHIMKNAIVVRGGMAAQGKIKNEDVKE